MQSKSESMEGKKILISGGTSGVGLATAKKLLEQKVEVMIFGRDDEKLQKALFEIGEDRGKVYGVVADSATYEGLTKVYKEVDEKLNGLDIFINNAAIGGGDLLNSEYKDWQDLININILGYIAFARYAIDRFIKQGSGHLVNIGSMSAVTRDAGSEVYNATKAAIQAFSESVRRRVNEKGVKVTLLEPGSIATNMPSENEEEKEKLVKNHQMLDAGGLAETIVFCLTRPKGVDIITVQIKPHMQVI